MKWIPYALFCVVFVGVTMWLQLTLLWSSVGQARSPITVIKDEKISQLVKQKVNVDIETIKITESDKPFGMMVGIPAKPQLILSRKLYETFTPDEIEYVVLHEAGHYVFWHSVVELVVGVLLLFVGIITLGKISSLPMSTLAALVLGLGFGVLMIGVGRVKEYQADTYSATHITNPQGMISATNKFRDFYEDSYPKSELVQFMFYRGNPYDNRIKMAEEEIKSRR